MAIHLNEIDNLLLAPLNNNGAPGKPVFTLSTGEDFPIIQEGMDDTRKQVGDSNRIEVVTLDGEAEAMAKTSFFRSNGIYQIEIYVEGGNGKGLINQARSEILALYTIGVFSGTNVNVNIEKSQPSRVRPEGSWLRSDITANYFAFNQA